MSNLKNFKLIKLHRLLKIQFKQVIIIQSDLVQVDRFQQLSLMHDEDESHVSVKSHFHMHVKQVAISELVTTDWFSCYYLPNDF